MQINLGSSSSSSSSQGFSTAGRIGTSCFFSVFLLMGLLFTGVIINETFKKAETHSWTEVPCTILSADARPTKAPYTLRVAYRYEWKGTHHTCDRIWTSKASFDDWADVQRWLDDLRPGSKTVCYVNPDEPTRAVLEQETLWFALVALFPLIFVLVGIGGIWFAWAAKATDGENTPTSSAATTNTGNVMPPLFGIPFFGIFFVVGCVAFKLAFLDGYLVVRNAESWPEVPATVVKSWVETHTSDDGTTYSVKVLFRYTYKGRTRHADTFGAFDFSSSGRKAKVQKVREYPPGRQVTCRVNPSDPVQAYIDTSAGAGMFLGLFTLIFVAVGAGGLLWTFKGMFATPVPCPMSGHLRGDDDDPELIHHADWLPDYRTLDGPAQLSPHGKRVTKLVGMIFVCLFWNGITGVFVYQIVEGWRTGSGELFMTLFITPFVLVGVGMLCGVAYFGLGLLNPAPRLQLADAVPNLGQTFALRWAVDSGLNRIGRLRIDIEGTEHATYRRGTDTVTDTHTFARLSLLDTYDPMEMAGGDIELPIPRDAMHSLTTGNNRVTWTIHVRGEIGFWPDIDDEYEIIFLPAAPERS